MKDVLPSVRRILSGRGCLFAALAVATLAAGCTSLSPEDPFESYNRKMFSINNQLDRVLAKPVAKAYVKVTPAPVRGWVGNFFSNLGDPWIGVNNLLQGKPVDALSDFMRFMVNSTIGIGGLLDVATEAQLPKHDEDFGLTLGRWGVGAGPYLVLPFLGSSSLRDAAGLALDTYAGGGRLISHSPTRYTVTAVRFVNARARFLGSERTIDEGTLDKYRFMRDFYLQQRRYKVDDNDQLPEYEDFNLDEEGAQPETADVGQQAETAGTEHPPEATGAENQLETTGEDQ
jgi:phospholipid-binding lipoprotein MlaA